MKSLTKTQQKLLQKSVDNIHYQQIKKLVNLEAELYYNSLTIGSPMPDQPKYNEELGRNYQQSKVKYLF